ncbi:MAG: hypothetical protein IJO59_01980 [Clostridia bacterium]|nr:hypothetical protein [Clostridia bacterium]
MLQLTVAAVALAGEYEVGFDKTPSLYQTTVASLREAGVDVLDSNIVMYNFETMLQAKNYLSERSFDVLLVCVGTWSEDHHLLDLLGYFGKPVILHAYPGVDTGSLCGVQQIGSVFRDIGFSDFGFVFGEAGDAAVTDKILQQLRVLDVAERMKHVRVASIGNRCAGMTETAFDEFALLETFGARVVTIDESELLEEVAKADESDVARLCESLKLRFCRITSTDAQLRESAAYYLAMKALVDRYGLAGLAIKCYTKYMGKICLAGALLAEEGVVCACEGDVNNTVMMKILNVLSGDCVNCTDILKPDAEDNTLLFAHCGNTGFAMANSDGDVELCPVRIMEQGVCGRFVCKPGFVTAADLVGHGGTLRMSVMTGEAVPCGMEFPGTPIKIRTERPVLDICEDITMQGCGHHWMVCYGNYKQQLKDYCKRVGIEFIDVDQKGERNV